jgi:hypothetical protein
MLLDVFLLHFTFVQSQVNLIISLKRMLDESEIIMKFANFLSNDTGESTKHFEPQKCGFGNLHEIELAVREFRDILKKMWSEAPARAKEIAETVASASIEPRAEVTVDLSNYGNRIRSLAEMCEDCNTDLESACISVQRSGVGFVNPRATATQSHTLQHQHTNARSSEQQSFVPPDSHQPGPTQHQHHLQHQQPSTPQPLMTQMQPMLPDFSATTQTVMQMANIKLMTSLIKAIQRIGSSSDENAESSEDDSQFNSEPRKPDIQSQVPFLRPSSAASQASRPPSALSQSSLRPSSALSRSVVASAFDSGASISSQRSSKFVDSKESNAEGARLPSSLPGERRDSASTRPPSAAMKLAAEAPVTCNRCRRATLPISHIWFTKNRRLSQKAIHFRANVCGAISSCRQESSSVLFAFILVNLRACESSSARRCASFAAIEADMPRTSALVTADHGLITVAALCNTGVGKYP